jgi:XTP/dITP diphosphohydrolase
LVGDKSFGELSGDEKDKMSHRGRALRKFAKKLKEYEEQSKC